MMRLATAAWGALASSGTSCAQYRGASYSGGSMSELCKGSQRLEHREVSSSLHSPACFQLIPHTPLRCFG